MRHSAGCGLRCHSVPGAQSQCPSPSEEPNKPGPAAGLGTAIKLGSRANHRIANSLSKRWQGFCPVAPGIATNPVPCWASKPNDEEGRMLERRPERTRKPLTQRNSQKGGNNNPCQVPCKMQSRCALIGACLKICRNRRGRANPSATETAPPQPTASSTPPTHHHGPCPPSNSIPTLAIRPLP